MPLRLRVISKNAELLGDEHAREFAACGGTIGRSLDNDWVLPDPKRYVSGRHALIDFQGGCYYLVDTSRNGVFVNGADTPVGSGHPQRLFDGDRISIGEFQMLAEITADDGAQDDGMGDSVVRSQQVSEDPSVELQLMDADRMVDADALERHLSVVEGSAKVSQLSEVLPMPGLGLPAQEEAAALLLEAAGLKPKDLAGTPPSEVLRSAGKLLQLLTGGLMQLLQTRSATKETFRISQTLIKREQNNPLKFSPGVPEALKYLLGDRSESYLPAEDAIARSFEDLRQHETATVKAMGQAVLDYVERLDPDELRSRFDKGLKRNGLLAGANKLKYWELYEETYHVLTYHEEGSLPESFNEEFARAYEAEIKNQKPKRRAG
ncbi:MAG: type VI secretion system-associated FHA domain protein TagH [Chromatiales bacterium]|nr:MAG: type VI secretion system-associated FHA domain protein TagH [Chromatiales bacterium]